MFFVELKDSILKYNGRELNIKEIESDLLNIEGLSLTVEEGNLCKLAIIFEKLINDRDFSRALINSNEILGGIIETENLENKHFKNYKLEIKNGLNIHRTEIAMGIRTKDESIGSFSIGRESIILEDNGSSRYISYKGLDYSNKKIVNLSFIIILLATSSIKCNEYGDFITEESKFRDRDRLLGVKNIKEIILELGMGTSRF